jgi:hypothetical protein
MGLISSRLLWLGTLLARRYGAAAVQSLARSAQAWLADPANEQTKAALVAQLRDWQVKATGVASQTAGALARQVERRRVSVSEWERDVMELRYELPGLPAGPVREAALRAYENQLRGGVHLIAHARRPERAREHVVAALQAERRMLATEGLQPAEVDRLEAAVDAALAACAGMFRDPPPPGDGVTR